ncbi:MAG: hypothetical protein ABI700_05140 [Chloroflexota bacterium]
MKRLLIPVFFLILAILACDEPYYDPVHVIGVKADTSTTGRVYAVVGNDDSQSTYRSDDYGHVWQQTTEIVEPDKDADVTVSNEKLYQFNVAIWSFPRPTYRFFFLSDDDGQYFKLPNPGGVSSSRADGVLYVAMGTEGVLVYPAIQQWYLSANGIDLLHPLRLTITDAPTILAIIVLALLVPPLPLLNAYLLSRVWLYALPPKKAWRLALRVSAILAALAAVAITIWLTDARTDYYTIVAVMGAISLLLGVGATIVAAPADKARRLAWRAGLVSLIVPIGVAAIWAGWLFILPLVGCYMLFRALYTRMLRERGDVHAGLADTLTVQSLVVVIACTGTFLVLGAMLGAVLKIRNDFAPLEFILGAIWAVVVLWQRVAKRFPEKSIQSIRASVSVVTVLCYPVASGLAVLIFFAQSAAYSWFTHLLIAAK